uniref:MIP18957p n=1 Tax=Drosophila melanogaster TaxID=7227 RepID=D4G7E8_DROME|nr:MIP18957p [Drosophila melanogaster]
MHIYVCTTHIYRYTYKTEVRRGMCSTRTTKKTAGKNYKEAAPRRASFKTRVMKGYPILKDNNYEGMP